MSYPVVVEETSGIRVVRDDLVPGGTKARVIHLLFDECGEYVYAGPCQGYAQVALAYACKRHNKRATLFCAKRNKPHPRTVEALSAGATVHEVPYGYLSHVRARARAYCDRTGATLLPFGLADRRMVVGISMVAWQVIPAPEEVWSVAGSGTLSMALQMAWPDATINAVIVGQRHESIGRAKIWTAPEKYEQSAKRPPPFPSCNNYDAKAWRFVLEHAASGALFWNVAA